MYSSTCKRWVVTFAVTAGLLGAAIPASAKTMAEDSWTATSAYQSSGPSRIVTDNKDPDKVRYRATPRLATDATAVGFFDIPAEIIYLLAPLPR